MRVEGVKVRASEALRASEVLWPALLRALEGRVAWAPLEEDAAEDLTLPVSTRRGELPWCYLECDFGYAPHRQVCAEGGETRAVLTRIPALFIFADAAEAHEVAAAAGQLRTWLASPHGRFEASRPLLLSHGSRTASLGSADAAKALIAGLLCGLDIVELHGALEAAEYVAQCAAAVAESRKRRVPSRFKVAGVRCQTLRDPGDKLRISWVSQLMQIPGVSEEIAKVVAERWPSPGALLGAVARAGKDARGAGSSSGSAIGVDASIADSFLAEMEYPIRGKKCTRRIGPIVSRRVYSLFHPGVSPELVLV